MCLKIDFTFEKYFANCEAPPSQGVRSWRLKNRFYFGGLFWRSVLGKLIGKEVKLVRLLEEMFVWGSGNFEREFKEQVIHAEKLKDFKAVREERIYKLLGEPSTDGEEEGNFNRLQKEKASKRIQELIFKIKRFEEVYKRSQSFDSIEGFERHLSTLRVTLEGLTKAYVDIYLIGNRYLDIEYELNDIKEDVFKVKG